jgi:hypothetical protein
MPEVTHVSRHGFWLLLGDATLCASTLSVDPAGRYRRVDQRTEAERGIPSERLQNTNAAIT